MLRDLFIDFTIVVTLATIGTQLLNLTDGSTFTKRIYGSVYLSIAGILLMQFPIEVAPGVLLDFRRVPILLAALYRGPIWGVVTAVPIALYRVYVGGAGMAAGCLTILGTVIIGGLFRSTRHRCGQAPTIVAIQSCITFGISSLAALTYPEFRNSLFLFWYPLFLVGSAAVTSLSAQLIRTTYLAKRRLNEAREQALTDHLTGLPNLRAFENDLPNSGYGYLLLIDVDRFKRINDIYGHSSGDLILLHVGRTIARSVRAKDLVYRYGGEEFAVLLQDCLAAEATTIAERVRANVEGHSFTIPNGQAIKVTVSGGLSPVMPGDWKAQIHAADALLYRSKGDGRNRICVG